MTAVLTAQAIAHPNIALIKYWGKLSNNEHNEPAVSSLSITLDTLETKTRLTFDTALVQDEFFLNGSRDNKKLTRVTQNLDKLRTLADIKTHCKIESENNFPTGAGLASSASGFAALVVAGDKALNLNLDFQKKSMLARSMSGSAARSIGGGFVKIFLPNKQEDHPQFGSTYAEKVADQNHWPLEICVAVVSEKEKSIGSTEGMEASRFTSPYYSAWVEGNDQDIEEAEALIKNKDFQKLADLSEFSCLKMHALALATRPGLIYWSGATVEAMHCIRQLRASGIPVFFTIDAGPQVKAICAPGYGDQVEDCLKDVVGVQRIIRCGLGKGAYTLD